MKTILSITVTIVLAVYNCAFGDTFGNGANTFQIDFATIGNPGNIADTGRVPDPAGSVDYIYRIGKYEISEDMFYKANLLGGLGLTGSHRGPNKPVTFVSWFEAAQFVNWLNTSTGNSPAYKFTNGTFELWQPGDDGYDAANPFRNTQAGYFLPSADEWYKAAYYNPVSGKYSFFTTGSSIAPTPVLSGTAPNTAVFRFDRDTNVPADITQAGGLSHYGTMAQGGNVHEYEETEFDLTNDSVFALRGVRGGDWDAATASLGVLTRKSGWPGGDQYGIGFRVASVVRRLLPTDLAPGDYNGDGTVDAADYVVWRSNLGLDSNLDTDGDGNGNGMVDTSDLTYWQARFGISTLPPIANTLAGDYNGDGILDGADYLVWRNNMNSTTNLAADGNGNGTVDAGDLAFWRAQFGNLAELGSGSSTAVPEPSSLAIALVAGIALLSGVRPVARRRHPA